MARDHYIPATYLAIFSDEVSVPRRSRALCIINKRTGVMFRSNAGAICSPIDFYHFGGGGWSTDAVDKYVSAYEPLLHVALEDLIHDRLSAATWASTLVPFVTSLFLRGPDFNGRFEARLGDLQKLRGSTDNTNIARVFEEQRLLMPVLAARWILVETSGNLLQITNDLGYTIFREVVSMKMGISVPIGPHHILQVIPTRKHCVAVVRDRGWWPNIERYSIDDHNHQQFLDWMAFYAQRFIIGPNERSLQRYQKAYDPTPAPLEPIDLGFPPTALLRKWEMEYFQFLARLSNAPAPGVSHLLFDFDRGPQMVTWQLETP